MKRKPDTLPSCDRCGITIHNNIGDRHNSHSKSCAQTAGGKCKYCGVLRCYVCGSQPDHVIRHGTSAAYRSRAARYIDRTTHVSIISIFQLSGYVYRRTRREGQGILTICAPSYTRTGKRNRSCGNRGGLDGNGLCILLSICTIFDCSCNCDGSRTRDICILRNSNGCRFGVISWSHSHDILRICAPFHLRSIRSCTRKGGRQPCSGVTAYCQFTGRRIAEFNFKRSISSANSYLCRFSTNIRHYICRICCACNRRYCCLKFVGALGKCNRKRTSRTAYRWGSGTLCRPSPSCPLRSIKSCGQSCIHGYAVSGFQGTRCPLNRDCQSFSRRQRNRHQRANHDHRHEQRQQPAFH